VFQPFSFIQVYHERNLQIPCFLNVCHITPPGLILYDCIILTTWERFGRNLDLRFNFKQRRRKGTVMSNLFRWLVMLWISVGQMNFQDERQANISTGHHRLSDRPRLGCCSDCFIHFSGSFNHRSFFIRYLTKQSQ